jgi:CheY-like chemotaxis protein
MKKILVFDDDEYNLEIVSFILTEYGYEVQTRCCGDTIFEDIMSYWPDLILMDVMLAGYDGRELCKAIKGNKLTSHIPVILISGTHDLTESLNLPGGPNDCIAKPFDIDTLLSCVKKQLIA